MTRSRWHSHAWHHELSQGFPATQRCKRFFHHLHFTLNFCFRFCCSQAPDVPSLISSTLPPPFCHENPRCQNNHVDSVVSLTLQLHIYPSHITAISSKWPFTGDLHLLFSHLSLCSFWLGHKKSEQNVFLLPHEDCTGSPQHWLSKKTSKTWRNR